MVDFLVYFLAFFITVPPVIALILYIIGRKRFKSSMRTTHFMVNWSTIFFIIAVDLMAAMVFGKTMTGVIIVFLLLLLGIIIYFQWRHGEIHFRKAIRLLWRITFLLFFLLYFLLLILGIIRQIIY